MYLIKTPFLLRWLYPGFLWNKNRKEKRIYLTFDDGPIPVVTPFVLKILKKFDAHATFFCIGDNVSKHPDIFMQVKEDGHRIGNHTFNHLKGWSTDNKVYVQNIKKCDDILHTDLFRPPYGKMRKSQAHALKDEIPGIKIIMWDVLSGDFDINLDKKKCLKNVLKHTENGSIIVFHDSLKAFKTLEYVLPKAMEIWSKEGYKFSVL